jgi:cell division septal protein FtsQ
MLQLRDKKNRLFFYAVLLILLSTINISYNKSQNQSILAIKIINVSGLSKLDNLKIQETLNPIFLKNIFFIKKESLVKILNNNNLIESIYVKKIYPNLLNVNIKKTDFLAITSKDNKKFIIASNGKLISLNKANINEEKLPFVFGNVDTNYFIDIKKKIDKSKFEYREIETFYFYPSYRIDIKTRDGILIKLPLKNLSEALRVANIIKKNDEFRNNKILDLRISNYIITSNE